MDFTVIIVNYNTAGLVGEAVESVLRQQGASCEIIVVDNRSQDHSLEVLRGFGAAIRLIENPENAGFARANNIAARLAAGEYLFLLNPDAHLVGADSLTQIRDFMRASPRVGLAGTRVEDAGTGRAAPWHEHYPGARALGDPWRNLPGRIAWLIGASMVLPRKLFADIGGFDEDFFLYGEDADICLRVRKRGFEIGYLEHVAVRHAAGASERGADAYGYIARRRRARILFFQKHLPAEDVRRAVAHDLGRARQRLFFDRLREILSLGLIRYDRAAKWRATCDVCAEFLAERVR